MADWTENQLQEMGMATSDIEAVVEAAQQLNMLLERFELFGIATP